MEQYILYVGWEIYVGVYEGVYGGVYGGVSGGGYASGYRDAITRCRASVQQGNRTVVTRRPRRRDWADLTSSTNCIGDPRTSLTSPSGSAGGYSTRKYF